jgi:hypothetical protein
VIGIVSKIGVVGEIITKKDERVVKKRDIVLVDDSKTQVLCTLWGDTVKSFKKINETFFFNYKF